MNKSTLVFLVNDDVQAIRGAYEAGENASTDIFKTFDRDIVVGDLVVVQSNTRHDMTVVKVTEVDVDLDVETGATIKWVVQPINQSAFAKIILQEGELIAASQSAQKAKRKAELRASLYADQDEKFSTLKLANHADPDVTE